MKNTFEMETCYLRYQFNCKLILTPSVNKYELLKSIKYDKTGFYFGELLLHDNLNYNVQLLFPSFG